MEQYNQTPAGPQHTCADLHCSDLPAVCRVRFNTVSASANSCFLAGSVTSGSTFLIHEVKVHHIKSYTPSYTT